MMRLYYADIAPLGNLSFFKEKLGAVQRRRREKVLRCRHREDRCRSLAAELLLIAGLCDWGVDYDNARILYTDSGKPYLAGMKPHYNISHSGALAVCVLSDAPIGVDIEQIGRGERIVERVLSEEERAYLAECKNPKRAFMQMWTRKEAYAKESGQGLGMDFRLISSFAAGFLTFEPMEGYLCSIYSKNWRNVMNDELTLKDIEKMEAEIEHRKLVVRKQALEDVKTARAQGDLSENFEYKAAKQFKNENESRIRYLEKMVRTAVIISEESAEDEVGINNTVDVYFEDDDEVETYKIVTTVRSNSLKNLISRESPLGAAIFGHKVGDRCEVKVNDDYSYFVQIRKIENTVDDGSDELRKF